jgi:hypothetical protein
MNKKSSLIVEASNLAEVTALLLSKNYMLYRPEADINGIDFLLTDPFDKVFKCQLKSRAFIHPNMYGRKNIWMIFPGKGEPFARDWFLIPHDKLHELLKAKHGDAPQWHHPTLGEYWHTPVSEELASKLSKYSIKATQNFIGEKILKDWELTAEMFDLDPTTDEGWKKACEIGYSVNGYEQFPDDSGAAIMSAMNNYWVHEHDIPDNLFILRMLLFFQLRQMYWDGMHSEQSMLRLSMLLKKIKKMLINT